MPPAGKSNPARESRWCSDFNAGLKPVIPIALWPTDKWIPVFCTYTLFDFKEGSTFGQRAFSARSDEQQEAVSTKQREDHETIFLPSIMKKASFLKHETSSNLSSSSGVMAGTPVPSKPLFK